MAKVVDPLDQVLAGGTVTAADVARVLGTTSRSVARWHAAEVSPRRESEERLIELKAVVDLTRRCLPPSRRVCGFAPPTLNSPTGSHSI
jgi:hypothetical protein